MKPKYQNFIELTRELEAKVADAVYDLIKQYDALDSYADELEDRIEKLEDEKNAHQEAIKEPQKEQEI